MLMVALQLFLVELQGFLLSSLGGIGHIALVRFFYTKHASDTSSSDKDFSEEASAFLVFKAVDGEDLLAVHICHTQDCLDLVETLTELALVKQHHNVRVVDDGFLHDRTADDVLNFLSDHTN